MEYCQDKRQSVIGYVNTREDDSLVPIETVKRDIDKYYKDYKPGWVWRLIRWPDRWLRWFRRGIDGIFFDQMSNNENMDNAGDYYRSLYRYIKDKSPRELWSLAIPVSPQTTRGS